MLLICETFSSIQGESTRAGRKCFFIRLAGCSLDCSYCDTAYAKSGGAAMSVEALVELARASKLDLVEITGGEPLEQPETPRLCRELLNAGFEVLLETNGAQPLDEVPVGTAKIVDCKLPSSKMDKYMLEDNYALLGSGDEVKFVVGSRLDFDCATEVVRRCGLEKNGCELLISPVWGAVDLPELAKWVMECDVPFRMQLQMHRIIWGDRRGV